MLAAHVHGVSLGLLQGDLSIWEVAFISSNNNWGLSREVPLELLDPDVDLGPGLKIGDVIHNQRAY